MATMFHNWVKDTTMLELSYLSLLPLPVSLAIVGSILVSVLVFVQSCLDMVTPRPPDLYYRESSLNNHVVAKCKMKERSFHPNLLLTSKHAQTILPIILSRPDVTYEREYLQMMDKGVVALDWVTSPHVKVKRKTPVLLIIPSLTEGAISMSSICNQAVARGIKPLVYNRRGYGGSFLTTPKLMSPGDPFDLRQVLTYIKQRLPRSPLTAIAYGSGCGLLLSYLGEFGSSAFLAAAVCVSPSFDEPARFSSSLRSPYDFLLLLRLKSILCQHLPALTSVLDTDAVLSSWTFEDLNRTAFGPFCDATTSDQYWEINNPMRDVDDISTPVLCINSLDDPINPRADIPHDLFKCYPNFLLAVTDRGGHCGFLEGFPPKSWSDALALDYAESVIEFTIKIPQKIDCTIARYRFNSISGHTNSFSSCRHGSDSSTNSSGGNSLRRGISDSSNVKVANGSYYYRVNGGPVMSRHSSFTIRPKRQRSTL